MFTVDDSNAISETQEASVSSRDGGMCVICGMYIVDVAHIIEYGYTEDYLVSVVQVDACKDFHGFVG